MDYGHDLRFGVFIPPEAGQAQAVVELAVLADGAGLDYITFQDHPYQSRFPHLRRSDPELAAVLDRLHEEHETIADLLERVDAALVTLVTPGSDGITGVQATVDLLTDALLSHFAYEERELIEPLARHGFY